MNINDLQSLLSLLIGQGNQIDIGGALPKILSSLMPIVVDDITALTDEQLNFLHCGSIVAKKTGKQLHAYIVSYKGEGEGEGLCLTYTDASIVETVSYDYTSGGWAYNSTDKTTLA